MLNRILQPHFIWRPWQFVKALRRKVSGKLTGMTSIRLPWGADIRFPSHDYIAHQLTMHGITALEACEAVFRLLDPAETAVDAGANIGTVSSAMIHCTGPKGRVTAFEMMPQTYRILKENYNNWQSACSEARAVECALSNSDTTVNIGLSSDFALNTGVAYATHGEVFAGHQSISSPAKTLDSFFPAPQTIHFLKLDVERHELAVLEGASELLKSGRLRDMVFEDDIAADSPVKQLLMRYGYTIFTMHPKLFGIKIVRFEGYTDKVTARKGIADYLATRDPQRVESRWASSGYRCLKSG